MVLIRTQYACILNVKHTLHSQNYLSRAPRHVRTLHFLRKMTHLQKHLFKYFFHVDCSMGNKLYPTQIHLYIVRLLHLQNEMKNINSYVLTL
jgi:hypothetical protein